MRRHPYQNTYEIPFTKEVFPIKAATLKIYICSDRVVKKLLHPT